MEIQFAIHILHFTFVHPIVCLTILVLSTTRKRRWCHLHESNRKEFHFQIGNSTVSIEFEWNFTVDSLKQSEITLEIIRNQKVCIRTEINKVTWKITSGIVTISWVELKTRKCNAFNETIFLWRTNYICALALGTGTGIVDFHANILITGCRKFAWQIS